MVISCWTETLWRKLVINTITNMRVGHDINTKNVFILIYYPLRVLKFVFGWIVSCSISWDRSECHVCLWEVQGFDYECFCWGSTRWVRLHLGGKTAKFFRTLKSSCVKRCPKWACSRLYFCASQKIMNCPATSNGAVHFVIQSLHEPTLYRPQKYSIRDYWLSRAKCAHHTPCSVGSYRYTSPRLGSLSNRHNHGIDISWESGTGVFSWHQGTSGDFLKWIYRLTCFDFQRYRSSHKPRYVPYDDLKLQKNTI